jgi:hypothetical protein
VERGEDGLKYINPGARLSAIISEAEELDGRRWLHISVAGRDHLPTWDQLRDAKEWLLGTERYAYQVLPDRAHYINLNPNVLHAFAVLDGPEPLPDFTHGMATL